ncbi:MAG: stage V sporulation protein AB [Lachnospiraceae bacterium]|nr:stage V sporulation protein AB [Lachnospiraceae bacterium]
MTQFGMGILGVFGGLMVSGGVFTALLALGLVPRFAGKTHTANHILTYESAVVSGCTVGGILSALPIHVYLERFLYRYEVFQTGVWNAVSDVLMSGGGFFAGCFVGCVALAIAELLDSIPIFARRIQFKKGVGIAVLAVAVGKTVGSLVYFGMRVYESMG